MKTARTISIRVNASQRCTGEVTPCAINHKIVACADVTILVSRTSARGSLSPRVHKLQLRETAQASGLRYPIRLPRRTLLFKAPLSARVFRRADLGEPSRRQAYCAPCPKYQVH